jgi:hypothetical protein
MEKDSDKDPDGVAQGKEISSIHGELLARMEAVPSYWRH